MRRISFLSFAILFALAADAFAANTVTIPKFGVGARPGGMGDAGSALYSDVTAVGWNPAGIARVGRPELGLMHADNMADSVEFAGFAYPVPGAGVFSVSGLFYVAEPMPVMIGPGQSLGDLTWLDSMIAVSFARPITSGLSFGLSGKFIQQVESDPIFGTREGSTFAMDAGVIYETPWKGLKAGLALLNTGPSLRMTGQPIADPLPRTARLGLAYEHYLNAGSSLSLVGDVNSVLNDGWYPGMGIEMKLHDIVFVRAGYYSKEGNIQGTTYGFGVRLAKFDIDYSNVPASEMVLYQRNNKISVLVHF